MQLKEKPNIAVEERHGRDERWRGLSQSEMDQCWKILAERVEEKVLDKYKVEKKRKRGIQRWRCSPLEWRRVRENKILQKIKKWREGCWARIFSLFKELKLQRLQCNSTEEEETKQQQRMAILNNLIKKIRSEERVDAKNRWWVSELLAGRM